MRSAAVFPPVLAAALLFASCAPKAETPAIAAPPAAAPVFVRAQPHLPTQPLSIKTANGVVTLAVEVAGTPDQQEAGLMFRRSVPAHGGMIFPMRPVRVATFWMKNTVIPLDMLFIRADGTIARITTARALSEDIDDSGEPVAAVLELGAGRAAALGIQTGDRVTWAGLTTGLGAS